MLCIILVVCMMLGVVLNVVIKLCGCVVIFLVKVEGESGMMV